MDQIEDQIDWAGFFDDEMAKKFWAFHAGNQHILTTIVYRARQLMRRGHKRCGIGMIFETMRWDHMMSTDGLEPFKLNNNYRAFYTRVIDQLYPDLEGFFTRRQSVADELEAVE